jgi:hypothetical protein
MVLSTLIMPQLLTIRASRIPRARTPRNQSLVSRTWGRAGKSMTIHAMEDPKVCKPHWFNLLAPTVTLSNAGDPINPDDAQVPRQDGTSENKPDWKSTTLAGLKLLLRTWRESPQMPSLPSNLSLEVSAPSWRTTRYCSSHTYSKPRCSQSS